MASTEAVLAALSAKGEWPLPQIEFRPWPLASTLALESTQHDAHPDPPPPLHSLSPQKASCALRRSRMRSKSWTACPTW